MALLVGIFCCTLENILILLAWQHLLESSLHSRENPYLACMAALVGILAACQKLWRCRLTEATSWRLQSQELETETTTSTHRQHLHKSPLELKTNVGDCRAGGAPRTHNHKKSLRLQSWRRSNKELNHKPPSHNITYTQKQMLEIEELDACWRLQSCKSPIKDLKHTPPPHNITYIEKQMLEIAELEEPQQGNETQNTKVGDCRAGGAPTRK